MLLPRFTVADLICNVSKVADVIAIMYVVDGKTTWSIEVYIGRCYCHGGRWNNLPGWVNSFGRC